MIVHLRLFKLIFHPFPLWYSYLQYSSIGARLLRRALKEEHRAKAFLTEESLLKVSRWANGKQEPAGNGPL